MRRAKALFQDTRSPATRVTALLVSLLRLAEENTRSPATRVTTLWVTLLRLAEENERVSRRAHGPLGECSLCQMTLEVRATVHGRPHCSTPMTENAADT